MNIAFFVDTYEPQINGVVTVVKQLKVDLEQLGCTVYVITPRRSNSKELNGVFYLDARPSRIAKNEYITTAKYSCIVDFCIEHKIDILHAHSEFGIAKLAIKTSKKLKLPLVMTFHTFWKHYIKAYVPFWFLIPKSSVDIYTKYVYKNAVVIFAVSKKVQDYLSSKKMLPNKKIILIENAIDKSTIFDSQHNAHSEETIAKIKNEHSIKAEDFVLLYFGRVSHEKRMKELLKIFANVLKDSNKPIKLFVLGDGPAKNELIEFTKKLGLENNVFFTGFIKRENLINYFKISKLFVSASISETYSMTVTEAMSAGLPVLLREDACYYDRVTNGKNGIMAKTDKDFEEALLDLVLNPENVYALAKNCKLNENNISSLDQAKKHLDVYRDILENWDKQ